MRGLFLIIALLGVVAMLTLGATGAWASPAPRSCHEAMAQHDGMSQEGPAQPPSPAKAQMVMACCIACVSPSTPILPQALAASHGLPVQPSLLELPHGRSPAPEHGPPRLQV